eukprot:7391644-Prymnesium_polylepis.3
MPQRTRELFISSATRLVVEEHIDGSCVEEFWATGHLVLVNRDSGPTDVSQGRDAPAAVFESWNWRTR